MTAWRLVVFIMLLFWASLAHGRRGSGEADTLQMEEAVVKVAQDVKVLRELVSKGVEAHSKAGSSSRRLPVLQEPLSFLRSLPFLSWPAEPMTTRAAGPPAFPPDHLSWPVEPNLGSKWAGRGQLDPKRGAFLEPKAFAGDTLLSGWQRAPASSLLPLQSSVTVEMPQSALPRLVAHQTLTTGPPTGALTTVPPTVATVPSADNDIVHQLLTLDGRLPVLLGFVIWLVAAALLCICCCGWIYWLMSWCWTSNGIRFTVRPDDELSEAWVKMPTKA